MNYATLSACIGLLVGRVFVEMVVGWASGRATMAARYDQLERAFYRYIHEWNR